MKITYIIWESWCWKSYIAKCYKERKLNSIYTNSIHFLRMSDMDILPFNLDTIIIDDVTTDNVLQVIYKAEFYWCKYLVLISEQIIIWAKSDSKPSN